MKLSAILLSACCLAGCTQVNDALIAYIKVDKVSDQQYHLTANGHTHSATYEIDSAIQHKAEALCGAHKPIISNRTVRRPTRPSMEKWLDKAGYGNMDEHYFQIDVDVRCE